jgi:hypothetical protein
MSGVTLTDLGIVTPDDIPATADGLLDALAGPTWLRRAGRDRTRARAVSALLHGNEPSGLRAVHALLRRARPPAVDVVCFIGAVEAARAAPRLSHRTAPRPGARDLNRCFRPPFDGPDGAMAELLLDRLRAARVEALVDLHNNTGHNPAYAIGAGEDRPRRALASLFTPLYVSSPLRLGSLAEAFDDALPAITLECGRAGDPAADAFAAAALARYADSEALPVDPGPLTLFRDPVRVTVRPGVTLAFAERPHPTADVTLTDDVDRHNFATLPAGEELGWVRDGAREPLPFLAIDGDGRDRAPDHLVVDGDRLRARADFVPIMMTTSPAAALADCLFYVVRPAPT